MTVTIEFAQIDAKDDAYTGYNTIGPVLDGRRAYPQDRATLAQHMRMEREYLTCLHALQEEIRNKYIGFFAEPGQIGHEYNQELDDDMPRAEYDALEAAAAAAFPGKTANYYT